MDPPATDEETKPENLEEAKEGGPLFHCDLFDTEIVHKIASALLPGLASACVDNTTGGLFKTPAAVAVDIRREMVDYLFQRSENFVAESVVLQGGPDGEVSDNPHDIILDFIDDFATSKRNFFSRVSGWVLSERREDRIDDFVQEMELNGFWLIGRREAVSQTLVKNVDVKNTFHCDKKFKSQEELEEHYSNCSFRIMDCENEGCDTRFSAGQFDVHDSVCPFKILPCDQKCPEILMRREMDRHCITVCPMKLTKCPFYTVGCQSIIPQATMDQHRSEHLSTHLVYIIQPLHREAPVEDLKKRVDQLLKLSNINRLVAARDARNLAYLIKDLEVKLGAIEVPVKKNKGEADGETNDAKEEKTGSSSKEGEANDTKEAKTGLPPVKEEETAEAMEEKTISPPKEGEASDTKEGKTASSPKEGEANDTEEEKTGLSPENEVETTDAKEEKTGLSPKEEEEAGLSPEQEDSLKPCSGKEEGSDTSADHIRSRDLSTSPQNRNLPDEKEQLAELEHEEEKSQESPAESKILTESPAVEEKEDDESTLRKEVHAQSSSEGH